MRIVLVAIMVTGVASSIGFAAHGIAALVTGVNVPRAAHEKESKSDEASRERARETSADPITRRNPFDSSAPKTPIANQPEFLGESSRVAGACSDVSVHAIAASSEPAWSFASLSTATEHVLARRGTHVGGREIAFVGRDAVWLQDDHGQVCRADLGAPIASAATTASAKPAPQKNARAVDPEIAKGIRATGPNSYDIDRATFDRILMSTAELMGDVRIAPDSVDGHIAGMKLGKLRAGSVLTLVGLKDGDRLDAINGIDLTSPEAGLEAFAKLQNTPKIVLKITRDGRTSEMQYDVK